jgi:hypothetical protein
LVGDALRHPEQASSSAADGFFDGGNLCYTSEGYGDAREGLQKRRRTIPGGKERQMGTGIMKKRMVVRSAVLASVLTMLLPLSWGCTKSAPKCDSGKATTAVIDAVGRDMKKDLAAIAGMGGPGMELSDDEWRTIRAGMVIDLENIKEQGLDENSGKRTCGADLIVVRSGKKKTTPITYVLELNKESGALSTTVSGLAESKEKERAPVRLPE